MLEFYYKYNARFFSAKSEKLAEEIRRVLKLEQIDIEKAPEDDQIPLIYKEKLKSGLFDRLNNLYYTIRKNNGINHPLLKKYLPEFRSEPEDDFLFADFFSGAGGLGQGLIQAGFMPCFVNDIYDKALETYYFNHHLPLDYFSNMDIRQLVDNFGDYEHFFRNVKVLAGGPPCQGFSTANRWNFELDEGRNKRFIEDPRNELYRYYVKLIGLIRPDFFIMENVTGMKRYFRQISEDIQQETGYEYTFVPLSLDAQQFDIPQNRRRFILIGGRDFMFVEKLKEQISRSAKKESTYKLQDALYGLPVLGTNPYKLRPDYESEEHGYFIRKVRGGQNDFIRGINGGRELEYVFNHQSRYNNENDLKIFGLLPEGGNSLHESIADLNRYRNRDHIFKDKYYKLKRDEVSKTITSHMKYDCHMYIHPEQARGLSPREAARIQTFPDDYVFRGNVNDWYKQIGNAVPVKLSEMIGKEIMNYYR